MFSGNEEKLKKHTPYLKQNDLKQYSLETFGVPELPPLFANVDTKDIHYPFPPIQEVTADVIRNMTNPSNNLNRLSYFKYVILEDGKLVIAKQYSGLIPIPTNNQNDLNFIYLNPKPIVMDGVSYRWGSLKNNNLVYFDAEGKAFLKVPLNHPDIAKSAPVVFAGKNIATRQPSKEVLMLNKDY